MKILVTGASGFIGSALVQALVHAGHDVSALLRRKSSLEFLKGVAFTRITGDLSDQESLVRACEGVDAVFHLAGMTAAKDRAEFFTFNAEGTRNLALAAAQSKSLRRLIAVSSLAASGPSQGLCPKTETDPDHPVSNYGESKLRGELYLEELKGQLPYIIIRPPMVYGPRDKNVFLIFKTISRQWMPMLPSTSTTGHKYYSAIHVDDLVSALIKTLDLTEDHFHRGEKYFVTDGQVYTAERIFGLMAKALGVKPIQFKLPASVLKIAGKGGSIVGRLLKRSLPLNDDKLNELLPDYWICSGEKLAKDLNFTPQYTMDTGIDHTVAWYKVNGWL